MSRPRLSTWLLAPLHAAALATGAKSFRDNPLIASPTLNRLGLHVGRMRLAHAMAEHRRRSLKRLIGEEDAVALDRDGFVVKRDFLPAEVFERLRAEALACRAPARDTVQGDAVTRRIPLDRASLADLPAVAGLLKNPEWLGLIRYAGASSLRPIAYIQTVFSKARAAEEDPQTRLHADTFHPTVKAWLFLTDVAQDAGPFVYVPGSHRASRRRLAWERRRSRDPSLRADFLSSRGSPRVRPEELRRLGLAEPVALAVPANTLIVADTGGFHARGVSLFPSVRVEIWAYGRRNPFLPWTGLDPLGAPLVRSRPAAFAWAAVDLGERIGLKRNPWRRAGTVSPETPPVLDLHG